MRASDSLSYFSLAAVAAFASAPSLLHSASATASAVSRNFIRARASSSAASFSMRFFAMSVFSASKSRAPRSRSRAAPSSISSPAARWPAASPSAVSVRTCSRSVPAAAVSCDNRRSSRVMSLRASSSSLARSNLVFPAAKLNSAVADGSVAFSRRNCGRACSAAVIAVAPDAGRFAARLTARCRGHSFCPFRSVNAMSGASIDAQSTQPDGTMVNAWLPDH